MANTQRQSLLFQTGPYPLLVDAHQIRQVLACHATFQQEYHLQAALTECQSALWQGQRIPFLPLRHCLHLSPASPSHALVLIDSTGTPRALLGVDHIDQLHTYDDSGVLPFQGFHPELDCYFDALWADPDRSALRLCLRPVSDWLEHALADTAPVAGVTL